MIRGAFPGAIKGPHPFLPPQGEALLSSLTLLIKEGYHQIMRRPPIPGLVMADGWLQPYSRQIRDRQRLFDLKMKRINQRAGSLEEYARGYRYYGFNRDAETGAWTYREWAPAARRVSLIGDFNGWNRESHPLERNERGVWEITLPPDALAHGQKVKVHVIGADGTPTWYEPI